MLLQESQTENQIHPILAVGFPCSCSLRGIMHLDEAVSRQHYASQTNRQSVYITNADCMCK